MGYQKQEKIQNTDLTRTFFLAAVPPSDIAAQIHAQINTARRPDHWMWRKPEEYHFSLAFHGAVPDHDLPDLIDHMHRFAFQSFNIDLYGLGAFFHDPKKTRGREHHVLWARPLPNTETNLKRLRNALRTHLNHGGLPAGTQMPRQHMTLARFTDKTPKLADKFMAAANQNLNTSFVCDHIVLFETLQRNHPDHPANNNGIGVKYRPVARFALRP